MGPIGQIVFLMLLLFLVVGNVLAILFRLL